MKYGLQADNIIDTNLKSAPPTTQNCSNSPLFQCNLNISLHNQIIDRPILITAPILPTPSQSRIIKVFN